MAEIIPGLTRQVLARMTAGEKRFSERLRDKLEDDYLVWYDIPLGHQRRYPDFIVLHPGRGLLFLEVKDWRIDQLRNFTPETVDLVLSNGLKTAPNPFEQVRQSAYNGLRALEGDPLLRQPAGRYQGRLVMPYGWGVVFTNITRKQIEQAIPEEHRQRILPDHLTLYKDEITASADVEAFQVRLWGMFNYQFGQSLTLAQIDRIRWHLFPEVRISGNQQATLFETDTSDGGSGPVEVAQQLPDIVRIMDIQQEQLARGLGEGHRVIHGVAGSGKTLILGYRAQFLAEATQKPVLILCFNTSLAAKLRSFAASKGLGDSVQVYHFHEWCAAQLKTYHVAVTPGEDEYFKRSVTSVINAVDRGHIPRAQYGAVLIDEGHDFEPEWLKLVVQMIDPATNALLLLYDDAQAIYKKQSGLGFSLASVGIQAQGRTSILRINYRNTREILDFAYRFAQEYLHDKSDKKLEGRELAILQPESAGSRGPVPKVHRLAHWQQEVDYVVRCVQAWHGQGVAWRDMAIVYAAGYQGKALSAVLKQAGIAHLWMAAKEYKKAYDPSIDRVTIVTLHSSKGLEFPNVALVGLGQLKHEDQQREARLIYVGMTRAQRELHVCMSQSSELCDRIAALAG